VTLGRHLNRKGRPEPWFCDAAVFMTFTKHETTGDGPSPRSWHAAALMPNGTIFVYGGFNGDAAMNDAYILDPGALE